MLHDKYDRIWHMEVIGIPLILWNRGQGGEGKGNSHKITWETIYSVHHMSDYFHFKMKWWSNQTIFNPLNYRNLWIPVSPVSLNPTPPYFDVHLFRHVGELCAYAIRRAQSLRLDNSCISIYDTTTKFLGHVMSHHHPSGIIFDLRERSVIFVWIRRLCSCIFTKDRKILKNMARH